MMPAWLPVNEAASTPSSARAMHSRDMEIRSPVLTSMSYSRGGWTLLTALARWIRSSVVLPMALTTATTSVPSRRVRAMWSATARMRSASPTEVPPNFWTTRGIGHDANGLRWAHLRDSGRGRPDPTGPPGPDRVSGRAQREESPSASGAREPTGAEAKAKKRRKQIRNGVIVVVIAGVVIVIVFLTSSNSPNKHDDQSTTTTTTDDHHAGGRRQGPGAANKVAVAAGCPASTSTTGQHARSTRPRRP